METRPNALQSSTKIRFSFADSYMGRELHLSGRQGYTIRTRSLLWQDVQKNCNRLDVRATSSELGPYYGNYVQQKCNRPDIALIWKRMERVMESWLHKRPFGRSQLPAGRRLEKSVLDLF
jgi:hypothetical protein